MRDVGYESSKSFVAKERSGFWDRYLGAPGLDIGYRGGKPDAQPIGEGFAGVELGMPGYDGLHLPFPDQSQQTVYSSHVLEHVDNDRESLREWFRVLRIGGHMILVVPHAYLYERRTSVPPSDWSPEHLRCYTPATLLALLEGELLPNSYRIRHFADNDMGYRYELPRHVHPQGCLEIELVIQRVHPPLWGVVGH